MTPQELCSMVDHTQLKQGATWQDIRTLCDEAMAFKTASVCIPPCYVKQAHDYVQGKMVVCTVVGFPNGNSTTASKAFETREALDNGAGEIDMVINIGALKSGLYDLVYDEIRAVVDAAEGKPTKCILEIAYLTDDEIRRGAELAVRAGVSFVKTGTGWASKPTTVETIRIIRETIGDTARIKAAGGVRTLDAMLAMVDAGCSRFGIGLRSIMSIMKEVDSRLGRTDSFMLTAAGEDTY